jgi:phosphatidylglycerophosphate synthase
MLWPSTDGERWARQELALLRDARWSPRALLRFVAASQRRATLTRRSRPADARRAAGWMLVGAAAWVIAPSYGRAGCGLRARANGLAWWAGCALMLDWHLGMLETPDGQPVALGAADALTLARAWLVPAVAQDAAPALVLIGALSDLADGAVARRTRTTRFGRDLEGLVDACFTTAALRRAVRARQISRFPVALELCRLATGTACVSWVYFAAGHPPQRAWSAGGRRAAPLRIASLIAASRGRQRLADQLLCAATALACMGPVRHVRNGGDRPSPRPDAH